jgi:hypothetical protein
MPNVLISSEVRLAVSTSLHSALGYPSPADYEKPKLRSNPITRLIRIAK